MFTFIRYLTFISLYIFILLSTSACVYQHKSKHYYFNKGTELLESNSYDKAIEVFNNTIQSEPSYITAYLKRGIAYEILEEFELAEKDFKRIKSFNKEIINNLIEALLNESYTVDEPIHELYDGSHYENYLCNPKTDKSIFNKALFNASIALRINKECIRAYVQMGVAYRCLKMYSKAIINFNKSIELVHKQKRQDFGKTKIIASLYIYRGYIYREMQKYDKAINDFQKAQKTAYHHFKRLFEVQNFNIIADTCREYASILLKKDKNHDAIKYCLLAGDNGKHFQPYFYNMAGHIAVKVNDYDSAIKYYTMAYKSPYHIPPPDSEYRVYCESEANSLMNRAELLIKLKKYKEGCSDLIELCNDNRFCEELNQEIKKGNCRKNE